MWRKLWAFLNQPLFEQNSAQMESDLKLLERCWKEPYIPQVQPELQLLERCWDITYIYEVQPELQLLERCWYKPPSKCDH